MSAASSPPSSLGTNAEGFNSKHPLEFTVLSTPSCCVGNLNGPKGEGVKSHSRAGTLRLPHGSIRTPVFMPVGTKGTIKGLTSEQLYHPALSPEIILGNTYHLGLQPGTEVVARAGGLHGFMNWRNNLLTDSGGFQMVSLLELAEITEEGVRFASPVDGSEMMLTPEESIRYQNNIGADIMMQLDDVVGATTTDDARFLEAMHRSVRWLDRCIAAHNRKGKQNLFAIIQGGLDTSPGGLRDQCLDAMLQRDLPGYAIGGLAGGEDKNIFWKVVAYCTARLPADKPRYLMGVGYPVDLAVCVALGVDMFDCVFPTRTARFGVALVAHSGGSLRLKAKEFAADTRPLEEGCGCPACTSCSRSYLHSLLKENDALAAQYVTMHNVAYMMRLMRSMREAMLAGPAAYEKYLYDFLAEQFPAPVPAAAVPSTDEAAVAGGRALVEAADADVEAAAKRRRVEAAAEGTTSTPAANRNRPAPGWVLDALAYAGINVTYDL